MGGWSYSDAIQKDHCRTDVVADEAEAVVTGLNAALDQPRESVTVALRAII